MRTMIFLIVVTCLSMPLKGNGEQSGTAASNVRSLQTLVYDPRIVKNTPAPSPIPNGTLYSEWRLNGATYLVAYRNVDKDDPNDIVADIYFKDPRSSSLRRLISFPVFMQVENVELVSITGDSSSQLAFFRTSGQQDWLTIVALDGRSAHKLFDYGARWIKLTEDAPPEILAHSHPDNTTETFAWCKAKRKIVLEHVCSAK